MGTGYTRNDTANNIADGNVINASDLDGEFDAIQSAFNATTGHSHDGTTGEGPQIGTGGIADTAVTTAKIADLNVTTGKIANDAVTLGTKTSGNYVAAGAVSGVGLSGSASSEGATFTVTSNATNANTASTIVARDASGNFSAGTITAALTGTASNAALLDSLDSTQFLRSDAADTKTAGDLSFSDNVKAQFGAGNDLQIYHDASNSYITDAGTGSLRINGNNLELSNANYTANYLVANNGANVQLYYNGDVKITTTSGGIDVTGTVTFDGGTTSADLNFGDNDKAVFGAGSDLQIYHDGSDSYIDDVGTGNFRLKTNGLALEIQDSGDLALANFNNNGSVYLKHVDTGVSTTRLQTTSTGIDVTGDITVSGNVDGRDVASDGSKLDGIESGATADQSASEILTLIKTVDGSGSGLDADTLDSLDSSSFLRSNTADTKTSGNLIFNDNVQLQFGTSADLEIYHNGTNSIIADVGTGDIIVYTNGAAFQVDSNTGENMIYAAKDAGVNLYHNNNVRIQSTNAGATITGTLTVDGVSLGDNEKAQFGASNDLQIYHDGSHSYINDAGTGSLYILAQDFYMRNAADTAGMIYATDAGAVSLYYNGGLKLQTTSTGISVTGDVTSSSDENLKENIQPITDALAKVQQINGVSFDWKDSGRSSIGVIAQNIEKVIPEVVTEDDEGFKSVAYGNVVGLLIEAVKELTAEVEELKKR